MGLAGGWRWSAAHGRIWNLHLCMCVCVRESSPGTTTLLTTCNGQRQKWKPNLFILFASTFMDLMLCDVSFFKTFFFYLKQKNVKIKFVESYI